MPLGVLPCCWVHFAGVSGGVLVLYNYKHTSGMFLGESGAGMGRESVPNEVSSASWT